MYSANPWGNKLGFGSQYPRFQFAVDQKYENSDEDPGWGTKWQMQFEFETDPWAQVATPTASSKIFAVDFPRF